jgi:hypothetical protein
MTQQPFDYLQGDYLDRLQICILTLKTQTHLNNGQKWHKDTKGTGCGNMPSIPIMVEQTINNKEQTKQVDSFGRRTKEIDLQDKPPICASHYETQMLWIHLWSHEKQQQKLKKKNARRKAVALSVANRDIWCGIAWTENHISGLPTLRKVTQPPLQPQNYPVQQK